MTNDMNALVVKIVLRPMTLSRGIISNGLANRPNSCSDAIHEASCIVRGSSLVVFSSNLIVGAVQPKANPIKNLIQATAKKKKKKQENVKFFSTL